MLSKVLNHPLFKSSLIYTLADGINKAVPFFILPVLSHYLLPSDYGIVANFGVLLGIITLLISLSLDGAISVNYHKKEKIEIAEYTFNGLLLSLGIFLFLVLLSYFLKDWIFSLVQVPYHYQLLCLAMAMLNLFTTLNLVFWRLEERPLSFGLYDISNTIINVGFSLLFIIILKQTWEGRINGMAVAMIGYGGFSLFFLIRRGYIVFRFNREFFKDIFWFGLPLIPHTLSFWVRSGIDRIYITKFWGADAVGLYSTGFQFGLLVSFLVMAFNNAFSPYLYKTLSNQDELQLDLDKKKIVRITYGIMIGLLVCGAVFLLFSKFIIQNLFSEKYHNSLEYVNWAIVAQIFQGYYILFVNYIFFVKKTRQLATITIGCGLLQALLSFFLIKYLGPIGGAYSTVFISALNFICVMIYSRKVYRMPWYI